MGRKGSTVTAITLVLMAFLFILLLLMFVSAIDQMWNMGG
jgi:hypothetical protein